jgi:hypothetical protein
MSEPENLITKDKMVDIIFEVLASNATKETGKSILENREIFPEDYIVKTYKTNSLQFALSNIFYNYSIEEYKSIMIRVEQKLIVNKKELQSKIEIV